MTQTKSFIYGFVVLAILTIAYLMGAHTMIARGAVSVFSPSTCYTAAATTTLSYMTAGTATTTVTCPLSFEGADSATLALWVQASSTSSVIVGQIEYSDNGIDWYQNNQDIFAAGAIAIATPSNSFTWTYASTTVGGAGVGASTNTGAKLVKVATPTKWVRVILSNTGTNVGVWAKLIPRQPVN